MLSVLNIIYNIIVPIFIIVGLAFMLGHYRSPDPRVLSRVIFYLFNPFLIIGSIAKSDLRAGEIGSIAAMIVIFYLLMTIVSWILARLFHFDRKLESAFMLSVVVINAGNYGLPLSEFAFGAVGLQRAVVFFVITAILANTVGVFLASRGTASIKRSLFNMFTVPLPYATALGLFINLSDITLPLPLERAVTLLGQAAVPAMLVVLGLQLARVSVRGRWRPIVLATAARLVIAPLIAFPLAAFLGMSGITQQVVIVQASLPTAVISSVLAAEFGADAEFTAAVVFVSTLTSIATVTVLLWLVM
ncbi:MAG: AEC family transporter [Anaerolineae bacterium]|nr:AEC family transporter [Anaerolineae bacterium]